MACGREWDVKGAKPCRSGFRTRLVELKEAPGPQEHTLGGEEHKHVRELHVRKERAQVGHCKRRALGVKKYVFVCAFVSARVRARACARLCRSVCRVKLNVVE
eukprot:6184640-Pleurochrysis_carterae.AAC.4